MPSNLYVSVNKHKKISVKEYNKTYKYKGRKKEIENLWHLKNTLTVIEGALGMIKNRGDKKITR